MKKVKRERGFYKELSQYLKSVGERKPKQLWALEFWLKHKFHSELDIRCYTRFHYQDEFIKAMDYMGSIGKEDYEDSMLLRYFDKPRTRRQKAICKSQLSSVPHINEIS